MYLRKRVSMVNACAATHLRVQDVPPGPIVIKPRMFANAPHYLVLAQHPNHVTVQKIVVLVLASVALLALA